MKAAAMKKGTEKRIGAKTEQVSTPRQGDVARQKMPTQGNYDHNGTWVTIHDMGPWTLPRTGATGP